MANFTINTNPQLNDETIYNGKTYVFDGIGWVLQSVPSSGGSGIGIESIVQSAGTGAAGTVDTYTITYSDFSTSTFQVRNGANGSNGRGINTITRTSGTGLAGSTDTYTITFTDASTPVTFTVINGINGTNGTNGATGNYIAVKVTSPTSGTTTLAVNTETALDGALTSANAFTLALAAPTLGYVNEYVLLFKIGASLPPNFHPAGVIWRGAAPTFAINTSWTVVYEQVNLTSTTFEIWGTAIKNA